MNNRKKLEQLEDSLKVALDTIGELKNEQQGSELVDINETMKAFSKTLGELKDAII